MTSPGLVALSKRHRSLAACERQEDCANVTDLISHEAVALAQANELPAISNRGEQLIAHRIEGPGDRLTVVLDSSRCPGCWRSDHVSES